LFHQLELDAVPTVDVRLSIIARRLAALEDQNSAKKDELEQELHQIIKVILKKHSISILSKHSF